jgi:hypothetical protein
MDLINGTISTAIVGGLLILAFLLGPRLAAGSLVEESTSTAHFMSILKAERARLQTMHRRRQLYAELRAFASGGALVLTGWILAAIYCFAAHKIPA